MSGADISSVPEEAGGLTTTDLGPVVEQAMPVIDRYLAAQDMPLTERPLPAAIRFVQELVKGVQEPGQDLVTPRETSEFLATKWFADLYSRVDNWYRAAFPGAMDEVPDKRALGVVMIAGTLFAIRVPVVRWRPGNDNTAWISFPDGIRDNEQAREWIENPPNLSRLWPSEQQAAADLAAEVANALRFIQSNVMGIESKDEVLSGLKAGIRPRLHRAAELARETHPQSIQQAFWELQLACEAALKTLMQQRTGAFEETHDLFRLYDAVLSPPPAFSRDLLKRMPRWQEAVELRYGQGPRKSVSEFMVSYRAALAIVRGTLSSMRKWGLGNAEFQIGRLPWMEPRA